MTHNENNNIYKISDLDNIYKCQYTKNFSNGSLYVDLENTCLIEENILAKIYSNTALRRHIIKNTHKLHLNKNSNALLATRHDFVDFINRAKNNFKHLYFVADKNNDKIKNFLNDNSLNEIEINNDVPDEHNVYFIKNGNDIVNKTNNIIIFDMFIL